MPDRRGNIKCKDPVKLAAMAAAKAAGPSAAANTQTANSDEEGQIDDAFWAKEDATDERKQAEVWSNVTPCSWASQRALPRAGYRRVGDVYWPAPGDASVATTLTDAEKRENMEKKREKKERKQKKKREREDSKGVMRAEDTDDRLHADAVDATEDSCSEEQAKKKKKEEEKKKKKREEKAGDP